MRVFEQARGIGDVGYALTPWPDALAALDRIGVGDDVRAAGRPCLYGQHRDRGGRPLGYYISPATLAGTIARLGVGPLERRQEGDIPFWGRGELVGVFPQPRLLVRDDHRSAGPAAPAPDAGWTRPA